MRYLLYILIFSYCVQGAEAQNTRLYAIKYNTNGTIDSFYSGQTLCVGVYDKNGVYVMPCIDSIDKIVGYVFPQSMGKVVKSPDGVYRNILYPNGDITATTGINALTQASLDAKQPILGFTAVPNTTTVNNKALSGNISIDKADVGLGNADNTADLSKPISTATQTALNLKLATNGNGSSLTGLTKSQVGLANVDNTSDASKPISVATQSALDLKANITSQTFVTPNIGVASGTSLAVTGNISSSGGSIGYATGNGGTVTQNANRTTGVTINKLSGAITTNNASLAAGAEASFTVTNSTVAIGDVVLVTARSGQTANTSIPFVTAVANGSFVITLSNFNASTADTGAMVINFVIIKAVSN